MQVPRCAVERALGERVATPDQAWRETAGDGSTLGTVSSDRLSDLYRDLAKRGGGEPECVDALKETELNFLLWPDAKQDGLVVQPAGLLHVIAACGPALPIPLQTLRSLGV